jgi:hypothetical protein
VPLALQGVPQHRAQRVFVLDDEYLGGASHADGRLVPWKHGDLHKSRSAAPDWQGAKSELVGHK